MNSSHASLNNVLVLIYRYQKRVSNIIDDVLEWSPSLALSGMMEKQQTVVNATEPNNFTDAGESSAEKVEDVDGEFPADQEEYEEVDGNVEENGDHDHQHSSHI